MPSRASRPTRTPSPCGSTAWSSSPTRSPNCRWHNGISSSDILMDTVALLLLTDGRFPAGTHAHSGGLEAAVRAGRVTGIEELESFLRGRLATAGPVTAAFAAAAPPLADPALLYAELAPRTPPP